MCFLNIIMASPPQPTPSSSSKNGPPLAVEAKHTPPGRKIYPAVPVFCEQPRKVPSVVSRPPVKADGIPKASIVVAVPPSIPKAADPSQKCAIRLRLSLDNLSNLTSVSDSVRDDAIKAHRLPDCMAAHSSVLSNEVFFRQWHMRYSDDNMNLPGFHPQQSVTMVMGMPIMVPFVSPGSICNF